MAGVGRREPVLVTHILHESERKRVKLVFFHHHFNHPHTLKLEGKAAAVALTEAGEICGADSLPPLVREIRCPGQTLRPWPRGATVARLVLWPTLEEVSQGDGDRRMPDEVLVVGYSVCSREDNYEKVIGRHGALTDLLDNMERMGYGGEDVGAVARSYSNRVQRKKAKKERTAHAAAVQAPHAAFTEGRDPGDEVDTVL